eukprot:6200538-Pleurochrysis_carterae.AAC.1
MHTLFREFRPTAPKIATRCHLVLQPTTIGGRHLLGKSLRMRRLPSEARMGNGKSHSSLPPACPSLASPSHSSVRLTTLCRTARLCTAVLVAYKAATHPSA